MKDTSMPFAFSLTFQRQRHNPIPSATGTTLNNCTDIGADTGGQPPRGLSITSGKIYIGAFVVK